MSCKNKNTIVEWVPNYIKPSVKCPICPHVLLYNLAIKIV